MHKISTVGQSPSDGTGQTRVHAETSQFPSTTHSASKKSGKGQKIALGGLAALVASATLVLGSGASALAVPAQPAAVAGSQYQATRMAQNYLRTMPFSKSGLIQQLKYEGFSTRQATRAAGSVRVSWKSQAAKMARNYLETMPFSKSGLLEQLKFEGFTTGQAAYGVRAAF